MKLHLGAGGQRHSGFLNTDIRLLRGEDLVCDARRLPFSNNSIEEIENYHLIEHLPWRQIPSTLLEWYRVLRPQGRLVIECPDFDKAVEQYLAGNERRIYNIYGLQRWPGDSHLFGYNFQRLSILLKAQGFIRIEEEKPLNGHAVHEPCLRVICRKES